MRATLVVVPAVGDADAAVDFVVTDGAGRPVYSGRSQPWPDVPEPTSGQRVHVLDFTGTAATGTGFRVAADGAVSRPFAVGARLYDGLVLDALRFFRLMRCGAPVDDPVYGRPAGHLGDTAVPAWTGPDAARLYPGWTCAGTFDVSGGWYDAGDYGKYVTSGALAVWQLLGTVGVLGGSDEDLALRLREECRWQLDWLLRMQVPAGAPLADMAFHRVHGTEWSPLPGPPHEDPTTRVLHRPSTTATLHLAAAAAHGARFFRDDDPPYAARLLRAARAAYAAARRNPNLLAPDDEGAFGGGPYNDDDASDDFAWAAAELWLATGDDGADYLFGRNALGQSYVTGYGTDFSRRQRTRQFPTPPPGALAGGANSKPTPGFPSDPRLAGLPPQLCYLDEPTSEVTNDVCIRWNAPLVWVAAYLSG